jgi:hypothetical protein
MAAQQQIAVLESRLAAVGAARDRARSEAASAWRQLAAEQGAHAATRAASAAALDAAEAAYRRQLHASHMRELDNDIAHDAKLDQLRRGHVQELATAVAAAREAERGRLQSTVVPVLQGLQRRQAAGEDELQDTRDLLWEALYSPAVTRRRLK